MNDVQAICQYLSKAKTMEEESFLQKRLSERIKQQIKELDDKIFDSNGEIHKYNDVRKSTLFDQFKSSFEDIGSVIAENIIAVIVGLLIYDFVCANYLGGALHDVRTMMGFKGLFAKKFLGRLGGLMIIIIAFILISIHGNAQSIKRTNKRNSENRRQRKSINEKIDTYKNKKNVLNVQLDFINSTIKKADAAKKRYYQDSVIFPKYLNLVAVTQILEYFDSGRCESLTGPDGAYNLFENELRMNKIIGRLDLIIANLEEIRQTQYYMYQTLLSIEDKADKICSSIDYQCDRLDNIAVNTELTARYTEMSYILGY